MERIEKIWFTSEKHLEIFKEIKNKQKILSKLSDLSVEERYYDFPRLKIQGKIMPVIFENIGRLVLSENGIQYYTNRLGGNFEYFGINKIESFFLQYSQIESLEIIKPRIGLIPYFDSSWVKISYADTGENKSILLSHSGSGFVMRKIKSKNIDLMKKLGEKAKIFV